MSRLIFFLTVAWLSSPSAAAAAQLPGIVHGVGGVVINTVSNAKQLPVETGVGLLFDQCETVKKILKVDHEALLDKEPDLNRLTLNYYTQGMNGFYNLSEAAELIPKASWFDPSLKLYVYMHGFIEDPSKESYQSVNNAFLSRGNVNILGLDASSLIHWLYLRSSTYVIFIGEKLGEVLASMVHAGVDPASIHLIGHSLGSHIAGYAGKSFTKLTGLKVGRISGLDPAGPCFADLHDNKTLNSNDADFVDIIHTDAGVFGIDRPIGHVDFWPNGGSQQPNCLLDTCSHSRSWKYFTESITNPQAFISTKCADWKQFKNENCNFTDTAYMGFGCNPTSRGRYYLQTKGKKPYGRGERGLHYVNTLLP